MQRGVRQVFRGANVKLGNWRQVTVQGLGRKAVHIVKDR